MSSLRTSRKTPLPNLIEHQSSSEVSKSSFTFVLHVVGDTLHNANFVQLPQFLETFPHTVISCQTTFLRHVMSQFSSIKISTIYLYIHIYSQEEAVCTPFTPNANAIIQNRTVGSTFHRCCTEGIERVLRRSEKNFTQSEGKNTRIQSR